MSIIILKITEIINMFNVNLKLDLVKRNFRISNDLLYV